MPRKAAQSPQLAVLAARLKERLGNERLAQSALAAVKERAPDEQLALAFLTKLAENSAAALKSVLRDRAAGADLIFCLGSSELVATELSLAGPEWAEIFLGARAQTIDGLVDAMRAKRDRIDAPDRQAAAAELGRFMRRMMVQVAIADLLDRLSVGETAQAMSELADECIRTALDLAARFLGERARAVGRFCILAMGKLGGRELNLSSDVDLIYLHESSGSAGQFARRRRGSANGLPKFCRRDVFESICACGPAAAPRRWSRRSKARPTTTKTSASRGSGPRCCGRGRSRATSKWGFDCASS